ncbi:MAG: hypothetical protein A2Z34_01200 [Planctomycetes bacterium RBG_16_59_8]|nr:MAG: hypothetical protein A2Z34_01200 [Planctomycetes bacterium RBG_16_59_8]
MEGARGGSSEEVAPPGVISGEDRVARRSAAAGDDQHHASRFLEPFVAMDMAGEEERRFGAFFRRIEKV